ncbi:hypothetical protein I2750_19675 [Bacillus sp. PR5]|nr:hypothetical protein [Bacillus sp. PR5]
MKNVAPADEWLTVTVPAFLAAHPIYANSPTLALLLDALVRDCEEQHPDIALDAALLRASHERLVSQARILISASELL